MLVLVDGVLMALEEDLPEDEAEEQALLTIDANVLAAAREARPDDASLAEPAYSSRWGNVHGAVLCDGALDADTPWAVRTCTAVASSWLLQCKQQKNTRIVRYV